MWSATTRSRPAAPSPRRSSRVAAATAPRPKLLSVARRELCPVRPNSRQHRARYVRGRASFSQPRRRPRHLKPGRVGPTIRVAPDSLHVLPGLERGGSYERHPLRRYIVCVLQGLRRGLPTRLTAPTATTDGCTPGLGSHVELARADARGCGGSAGNAHVRARGRRDGYGPGGTSSASTTRRSRSCPEPRNWLTK